MWEIFRIRISQFSMIGILFTYSGFKIIGFRLTQLAKDNNNKWDPPGIQQNGLYSRFSERCWQETMNKVATIETAPSRNLFFFWCFKSIANVLCGCPWRSEHENYFTNWPIRDMQLKRGDVSYIIHDSCVFRRLPTHHNSSHCNAFFFLYLILAYRFCCSKITEKYSSSGL